MISMLNTKKLITQAKNCVDLGWKEKLRKKDR